MDTCSGHLLSFLLMLIQNGQLPVTGESMCTQGLKLRVASSSRNPLNFHDRSSEAVSD